jgi:DNA-binding CsgD family transcriptional regulator
LSDWIELIERARTLEGELPAWLEGLASAAAPRLGEGDGVTALALQVAGGRVRVEAAAAAGGASELADLAVATNRAASAAGVERVYRSGLVAGVLSEVLRDDPGELAHVATTSGGRYRDTVGIVAHASAGRAVALSSPLAGIGRMSAAARRRWERVASHVGSGLRLRDAVASLSLEDASVEAVFDAAGRVRDARGAAVARGARERLRAAVRRSERARGSLRRRDPEEALALWEALVAGRWSLVDHFDSDGRRFLVAHRNEPGRADPRGLSPREREVAERLGRGYAAKEIAYGLGLAVSTVANALGRARDKLGLGSLAELAALFAPGGLCARFAEYEVAGESIAVASSALLDPARLAALSEAEREVALLLLQGATNRAIAIGRGSAERTVANQIQSLYRKLGVGSRAGLAARVQRSGAV